MAVAKTIEPPSWISSGAQVTGGLDLLGLRLPVQFIGGTLLDGVTTVTPSVRYLAFRAWLIHRYCQSGRPDSWKAFTEFSSRIESALVFGNLIQDRSISGLIGTNEALVRLDANATKVEVSPLVMVPASTIYTGPSDQLGITKTREDAVPGLEIERGIPLAATVDHRLSRLPLIDRLVARDGASEVAVDDLREVGALARIDEIPDDERELLISAIIPDKPLQKERARIGSYASLLALASKRKARPTESDLFDAACSMACFGEPALDHIANGWTTYCVRDSIAVTQEAVLAAVMGEVIAGTDRGLAGVDGDAVIAALVERVEEHDSSLRDLGLLDSGESIASLSFRDLRRRVLSRVSVDSTLTYGIKRWPDKLTESSLYQRALKSGAGALSLAVVAWVLAEARVGDVARENVQEFGGLSYQGWRRLGLRDVILPELERFYREDRSLREVAATLAYRTVQQHLQISWSRLQVDLQRDVALLTAEGNGWFSRGKGFTGGRTASRIPQALAWLGQLKLIDDDGITADGDLVLKRAFKVLSEGTPT